MKRARSTALGIWALSTIYVIECLCPFSFAFAFQIRIQKSIKNDKLIYALKEQPARTSSTSLLSGLQASSYLTSPDQHDREPLSNRKNPKQRRPSKSHIKSLFSRAKYLEKTGRWTESTILLHKILTLDPHDSHSHLALARLQYRRQRRHPPDEQVQNDKARLLFQRGTELCPSSIHLWQAWAVYEYEYRSDYPSAERLFRKALELDDTNPYVCHAFGSMERKLGRADEAIELFRRPLERNATAALITSLADAYIRRGDIELAREVYAERYEVNDEGAGFGRRLSSRERMEVCLAAAFLEEHYFGDLERAKVWMERAVLQSHPGSGRAHVAMIRLEGRMASKIDSHDGNGEKKTKQNAKPTIKINLLEQQRKRFQTLCNSTTNNNEMKNGTTNNLARTFGDGRLYNAWASLEAQSGHLQQAWNILDLARRMFPKDSTIVQASGNIQERLGNFTGARDLYCEALCLEPTCPTLVALSMLELHHPQATNNKPNMTFVRGCFQEALLLDSRHGPAYNAYGTMEHTMNKNTTRARHIFKRGLKANCRDMASVYHGYAKLELSVGNHTKARALLERGLRASKSTQFEDQDKSAVFLAHTLGMLELNSHRIREAYKAFKFGLENFNKESSQLLLGMALCEVRSGNEVRARRWFEKAVNADKRHAHAWQSWGVMEMRAGNYNVAKTLLECGLRNCADHGALWQAYATMESRNGKFDVARTIFAAGIKKCPTHIPLYHGWARLEIRDRNPTAAKKIITEALTRDKTQGPGWLIAAKIEESSGNYPLSGLILRRGLTYSPSDPELLRALAEWNFRNNKVETARSLLTHALELHPTYAPLYHSLAELEAKVFNIEGLAKLNKKAAEVFQSNALIPPPSTEHREWTASYSAPNKQEQQKLPDGVAALVEEVQRESNTFDGNGDGATTFTSTLFQFEDDLDYPNALIEKMTLSADELVGDIFSKDEDDLTQI